MLGQTEAQQPLRDWPAETWKDNYREKKMTSLSAWRLSVNSICPPSLYSAWVTPDWASTGNEEQLSRPAGRPSPPGCLTVGAPVEAQQTPIESYQEIYTYWKEETLHTRHRCDLSFSPTLGGRKTYSISVWKKYITPVKTEDIMNTINLWFPSSAK